MVGGIGRRREEPEAYLGLQVTGFPNFFIMYGPNTNYFCVTLFLEQQARYIARSLKIMVGRSASSIEVRRPVMDFYNRLIKRSLSRKVFEANCHNYYHTATGRNVVTFPWRGSVFWLLTQFPGLANATRRSEHARSHVDKARTASKPSLAMPH